MVLGVGEFYYRILVASFRFFEFGGSRWRFGVAGSGNLTSENDGADEACRMVL